MPPTMLGSLVLPLSCVVVHSSATEMKDYAFPGIDGLKGMDMGDRGRPITVTGRLPLACTGATKASDIEALRGDVGATLSTTCGRTFDNCRVIDAFTDGVQKTSGGTFTCAYTIELVSYLV